jgi:mRNA-degrading endonuclease RelE of RelBE toxin-antitoxin system
VARRIGRRRAVKSEKPKPLVSSAPYRVFMTASAKAVYKALYEQSAAAEAANDPTNNHCTVFRMVDDAIRRLIPSDPLSRKYALTEPLSGIFRIKKGRLRIAWMAHSESRSVLILFISDKPRKEGDARDPYRILSRLMKAGYFRTEIEQWHRLTERPPDASIH